MVIATDTSSPWSPTRVVRVIRAVATSTGPLHVMTDAGKAYVKTLGNPEGPDALVSEWIGTSLARWLRLPTFDVAVVGYPAELRTVLPKGCETHAGPAFAARAVSGRAWDGTAGDLAYLANPEIIAGLVVLDTWTRNYDRYAEGGPQTRCNLRNVFFCEEGARAGRYRLLAIDHTECFRTGRSLSSKGLFSIDSIRDERLYGLFPAFIPHVTRDGVRTFVDRLSEFRGQDFDAAAMGLPAAWGLSAETRDGLKAFCVERAKFLVSTIEKILEDVCNWQPVLPGADLR